MQLHRLTAEEQRLMLLSSFRASDLCHKDSKSVSFVQRRDLTRQSPPLWWFSGGRQGGEGPVAAAALSPALHHNKGNLNALLFYVHCCKILQGHCGPYKTESCQILREKARVWIERDGLFMLATLRGLLSEL